MIRILILILINSKRGDIMKVLFTFILLAIVVSGFGQNAVNGIPAQIGSHPSEIETNGGGRSYSRIGNGAGNYHMLIKFDLTGITITQKCTLIVYQRSSEGSGGADYDHATNPFLVDVSTVQGTWYEGSSNMDLEEGAVCWQYRAYSATSPTLWDEALSNSTINFVSMGYGGTHKNSTGVIFTPEALGGESYAVLDLELLDDLVSGTCGGFRISRAIGQTGEANLLFSGVKLRWDPTADEVTGLRDRGKIVNISGPVNSPNPFTLSTTIFFRTPSETLPVYIYNVNGALVNVISGKSGKSVWHGTDFNGKQVSRGIYIYTVVEGNSRISRTMNLVR
jgi:hypothetical protein